MSSWTLKEYLDAVKNDDLFESILPQLDASDDQESKAITRDFAWRESLVRSKHYFAGGSARYMFGLRTKTVVQRLNVAVDALKNVALAAEGGLGDRSVDVINKILSRFGTKVTVISKYAGTAMAIFGGPEVIRRLALVISENSNSALDGWLLEVYFFARIRKGGMKVYEDGETIEWSQGDILVVDPANLPELPSVGWLKPHKYNQGGYDAVYRQAKRIYSFRASDESTPSHLPYPLF